MIKNYLLATTAVHLLAVKGPYRFSPDRALPGEIMTTGPWRTVIENITHFGASTAWGRIMFPAAPKAERERIMARCRYDAAWAKEAAAHRDHI